MTEKKYERLSIYIDLLKSEHNLINSENNPYHRMMLWESLFSTIGSISKADLKTIVNEAEETIVALPQGKPDSIEPGGETGKQQTQSVTRNEKLPPNAAVVSAMGPKGPAEQAADKTGRHKAPADEQYENKKQSSKKQENKENENKENENKVKKENKTEETFPSNTACYAATRDKASKTQKRNISKKTVIRRTLFTFLCFTIAAGVLISGLYFVSSDENKITIVNHRFYYVRSNSMEPELPVGSLLVTKLASPEELQRGDTITYYLPESSAGYRTHQIIKIIENYQDDMPGYVTAGLNPPQPDDGIVPTESVAGKVVFCLPYAGCILNWAANNAILIIAIITVFLAAVLALKIQVTKSRSKSKH